MKTLILIAFITCSLTVFGQTETEYQRYLREHNERLQSMKDEKDEGIERLNKEWEEYYKAEKEAYENFVKKTEARWGKGNVKESTQTGWVEYSEDGNTRSSVDFETGEATIEILQEKGEKPDIKKLEDGIRFLITNKGKTKDYDSEVEQSKPLQETPVLENQVIAPDGKIVTEENIDNEVVSIIKNSETEVTAVTGTDNKERTVVTVRFNLAPDYIRTRAEQYNNEVMKYCNKYDIDPALVFAVIQTESSFNPKAKSHVPAYGLMQIVPKSAGADCAKSLNKKFKIPTANYLYEPENNIEMGIHYLYLLKSRYFSKVTDKDCQTLCIIASYNTGAGNVARALRGDTNISKAIPQINKMSYDQLFNFFKKNLHKETQNYIVNVTERMNNFKNY
ncbi:MAG: murein transglycosylase domain-containing protein [Candidatus Limimorpha sp.]